MFVGVALTEGSRHVALEILGSHLGGMEQRKAGKEADPRPYH